MKKTQNVSLSMAFTIIIAFLQTVISILPGTIIISQENSQMTVFWYLFFYLLTSEFFQVFSRATYRNGKAIPLPTILVKLFLSGILIIAISNKTVIQFGVILALYELFQFLTFSKQYFYLDSVIYTLVNTFFKGFVFNQVLCLKPPYSFKIEDIQIFFFSTLVVLLCTLLGQGFYSYLLKSGKYLFLSVCVIIGIFFFLTAAIQNGDLSNKKISTLAGAFLLGVLLFLASKKQKQKEFIANILTITTLLIYYL